MKVGLGRTRDGETTPPAGSSHKLRMATYGMGEHREGFKRQKKKHECRKAL